MLELTCYCIINGVSAERDGDSIGFITGAARHAEVELFVVSE